MAGDLSLSALAPAFVATKTLAKAWKYFGVAVDPLYPCRLHRFVRLQGVIVLGFYNAPEGALGRPASACKSLDPYNASCCRIRPPSKPFGLPSVLKMRQSKAILKARGPNIHAGCYYMAASPPEGRRFTKGLTIQCCLPLPPSDREVTCGPEGPKRRTEERLRFWIQLPQTQAHYVRLWRTEILGLHG